MGCHCLLLRGKQAWSKCVRGFPSGSVVKNLPADAGDVGSIRLEDHWVKEIPTTLVFFPGESHGQRATRRYDLETKSQI